MSMIDLGLIGYSMGISGLPEFHYKPCTVASIQRTVAAFYGIPFTEMVSHRRQRHVARPRQVAMYLARDLTNKSFPVIGRLFGSRDHTTVLYGVSAVEERMKSDRKLDAEVTALRDLLQSTEVVKHKCGTVSGAHFMFAA